MAFVIEKAKREKLHIKVLLSGSSGSGKTYSALRLATGIKKKAGGEIVLINTEGERGHLYGNKFDYGVLDLEPPCSPERYMEAIDFAIDSGASVIILDSISHEWTYLNDFVNAMQGNSFQNWAKIKPRHRKFIDKIIQAPVHMIVTGRGKDEYVLETNDKGKQTPKKVGLGIQSEKDLEYEFQVSLSIIQSNHCVEVLKDNTDLYIDRIEPLTEKDGEELYAWANDGVDKKKDALGGKQKMVFDLIVSLGGSKNEKVMNILKSNGVTDPRKCNDEEVLNTIWTQLNEETENKEN